MVTKKQILNEINKLNDYVGSAISQGNLFESNVAMKAKEDIIAMSPGGNSSNVTIKKGILRDINNITKEKISDLVINEYILLQLNSDYYINSLKFETENNVLFNQIRKLIKAAFYAGAACIDVVEIMGEVKYAVYLIQSAEYNMFGEIVKLKLYPFNLYNFSQSNIEDKKLKLITFNTKEQLKNIIVFNWGINALSVYLRMFPFIRFQAKLLNLIVVNMYNFNKKFTWNIADISEGVEDLRLFFTLENPFIVKLDNFDLTNKIGVLDNLNTSNVKELFEYYKDSTGIMHELNGKRINDQYKKERNLVSEVNISEAKFEVLERNIKIEFDNFVKQFNENEIVKRKGDKIDFKWDIDESENTGNSQWNNQATTNFGNNKSGGDELS